MELSLIFDILSAIAVILGIIFGLLQLRHYHLSRMREADLFLLNSFQTPDFLQGGWLVQELPDGLSKKEVEGRLGEEIKSVYLLMSAWERIGILVFNRELSIDMVVDAYCGQIMISWQKLRNYVTELRKELRRDSTFEWFQWLAERVAEREQAEPQAPAYLAHQDWK